MSFYTIDQILNSVYTPSGSLKTFYTIDEVLNGVYDSNTGALKISISGDIPVSGSIGTKTTIDEAETSTNNLIYVDETYTFYKYTADGSSYTRNGFSILNTGNGGNTRYIGISGKYTEILDYEQLSTKELNGIPSSELSKFTVNYNPTSRVLTLTHISDYKVYVQGKLFIKTSNIIMPAHNNTTGLYYYYFDTDGILKMSLTLPDVFNSVAFVNEKQYKSI